MSDEDIKEKITSKNRDLTREEELERGKVWNITTQRCRSKISTEQAYNSGLLYLAPLNCYLPNLLKLEIGFKLMLDPQEQWTMEEVRQNMSNY